MLEETNFEKPSKKTNFSDAEKTHISWILEEKTSDSSPINEYA